ncbi:MAG: extensin family protein [Pseudomonadota bacterium]
MIRLLMIVVLSTALLVAEGMKPRPMATPEGIVPSGVLTMMQGRERSAAQRSNRDKYAEIFSQAAWRDAVETPSAPCGDTRLEGEMRAGFTQGACYINAPVYLTGLAGVDLDRPIITSCTLARHLADWVESDLAEVSEAFGRGVDQIISYGSYNCRTIGNREGGRLSTHGFAASIDIAGFTFGDGRTTSLLSDWDSAAHGPYLRAVEQSFRPAGFTRVLGPEDNAAHRDHWHIETVRPSRLPE